MNRKKALLTLFFLAIFSIFSCGKKSDLTYPGERKKPKFDKFSPDVD